MHHRRRGLTAALAALLVVLALAGAACSDDGGSSSASGSGAGATANGSGSTRPTGTIVPGGTRPPPTTPGPGTPSTTTGGDPSADIPRDQFCRGFAVVRGAETAMADALDAQDLASFKTAFVNLTTGYQAMAENPPDEVYEPTRAVYFAYDDLAGQVASATSTSQLTGFALQIQGGDAADDLEAVRDYGSANC